MEILKLFFSFFMQTQECKASVFGYEGDALAGEELACTDRLGTDQIGIAHRTLPCGAKVFLYSPRTGKSVVAKVVDHGPYGAINEGKWMIKHRASDPGKWRGCLDLTRKASKALGHNGFESIMYAPVAQWKSATLTR